MCKFKNKFKSNMAYEVLSIEYDRNRLRRRFLLQEGKHTLLCEWGEIKDDAKPGDLMMLLNGEMVVI